MLSPSSTTEELFLAQKLLRALGGANIDHRLRQADFRDEAQAPLMPWLGQNIADLDKLDAALLIGSHVRKEQPIIAHRLRQAVVKNSAAVHMLNMRRYDYHFALASNTVVAPQKLVAELAAIAKAAFALTREKPAANIAELVAAAKPKDTHKAIAKTLKAAHNATVLLGEQAAMHPDYSVLRALAAGIAVTTASRLGYLSAGANSAGAWLAGAVPHRGPAGKPAQICGVPIGHIDAAHSAASLLLNVEPQLDVANAAALMTTLQGHEFVVAISAFDSAGLRAVAHVILPCAAFAETSGTYVNAEGYWQSFNASTAAKGAARPAWKILRVLGNLLKLDGFDYDSSEQVRDELRAACTDLELNNTLTTEHALEVSASASMMRAGEVPIYASDALTRRASALQKTADAEKICARLNSTEAKRLGLEAAVSVMVTQGEASAQLPLIIDDSIPDACCWIAQALTGNELLGAAFGAISVAKV
jgi:NADH-quinone oxidoreductase subunit G